jgi:hypothetical protein
VWTKDVRHEDELVLDADGARRARLFTEVPCRAHEFGVRVAHLVLAQTTTAVFVDEVLASESVVDGTRTVSTAQRTCTERHGERLAIEYPP